MRRLVTTAALGALVLAAGEARPCGGAFGDGYTIDPSQNIVVSYREGVETYVFNPRFCGQAGSFGLILPVPGVLSQNPTLCFESLYTDLAKLAAPTIVTQTVCQDITGGGSRNTGVFDGGSGTTVIERGQVGIFDWALLQATSVASFTDWLSTNGFPYQSSAQATFQYYVSNGWYFVAFKVSAGTAGTSDAGTSICGNFGPVMLAFPVAQAVVPARIANVSSSSFSWTVYTLGAQQFRMRDFATSLRFSGTVGTAELTTYPGVASVAQAGDRLTELLLTSAPDRDLILEPDPNQADYRRTEYRYTYVTCTGGTGGTSATDTDHDGMAAPAPAAERNGGCSVRSPRAAGRAWWITGLLLLAAMVRSRRRT